MIHKLECLRTLSGNWMTERSWEWVKNASGPLCIKLPRSLPQHSKSNPSAYVTTGPIPCPTPTNIWRTHMAWRLQGVRFLTNLFGLNPSVTTCKGTGPLTFVMKLVTSPPEFRCSHLYNLTPICFLWPICFTAQMTTDVHHSQETSHAFLWLQKSDRSQHSNQLKNGRMASEFLTNSTCSEDNDTDGNFVSEF